MRFLLFNLLLVGATMFQAMAVEPIKLHPQNPHYFSWRGKPTVLIGSGEHYGAVLNADFDYVKYLDTLQSDGLNLTRTFSGTYREVPGNFNIANNTLAPTNYLAPWARSETPGYKHGGNKFDLTKWDEKYFSRLKDFMTQAQKRGVVVEFVLFCPLYEDSMWQASPMNAINNVNGIGNVKKEESLTLKYQNLVNVQVAVTQKIVRELNEFDNLYFEICNEPYFGGVTLDWQARIAAAITEAEKDLPHKHLIAQNIANEKAKIENPNPLVSIFNFHYATPPDAVTMNYGLNKPITDDETGFKGNGDAVYRKEAWQFMLNGGSAFSHLDYSFAVGHEDGELPIAEKTPGGGGKSFRRQMRILKEFLEGLPFTRMKPAREMVRANGAQVYALAAEDKHYAAYLHGKAQEVVVTLPSGNYKADWLNVEQGSVAKSENFAHGGGAKTLAAPEYKEDIALKIHKLQDFSPTRISDNKRYLLNADGTPFFYLADTAWTLFHRLDYDESDHYLRDRAAKGYTVIQAVALSEHSGLAVPNRNGDMALENNDPTRPNEKYFAHVDRVVNRAQELGLVVGMLPTWGAYWNPKWDKGPAIFTPENARIYGEFLGKRYKDKPIIWILGGDRPIENDTHKAIIRNMAEGLKAGDGGRHLMTYHPNGGQSSAQFVNDEKWLDFNMLQSGHRFRSPNYEVIAKDYNRTPVRPCLDGEPGYENHPIDFKVENGFFDAHAVRNFAYWALFSGAMGHTYGCHDIWQFNGAAKLPAVSWARTHWREAMQLPGAAQMQWARRLVESRPVLERVPDQSLIIGENKTPGGHIAATRSQKGDYTFVYSPQGAPFTIDSSKLSGEQLAGYWFDPRTGNSTKIEAFPREKRKQFTPPSSGAGNDWVLILDDAAKNYAAP
jgi:hypothetical protein